MRKGEEGPAFAKTRTDKPADGKNVPPRKSKAWETMEAILGALLLALLLRTFVVQSFMIPTPSMVPTLLPGDHILVNKYAYGWKIPFVKGRVLPFWKPQRGDVVVFRFPKEPGTDFVKRCVAVGGDVVEMRDRRLFLNGEAAPDPHARYSDLSILPGVEWRDRFGPYTVPEGSIFVMGDNRDNSNDSRFWGPVDLSLVKGKAMIIYWSVDLARPLLPFLAGPWRGDGSQRAPMLAMLLYSPKLGRFGNVVR